MSSTAFVVMCALNLLGRSPDRLPPIKVVDIAPPYASRNAQGFVNRQEGAIYLVASAPAFRIAEAAERAYRTRGLCVERQALKMIASIIVHEEWHLRHGSDESGAYRAQLIALSRLGVAAGSGMSRSVTLSMQAVLKARSRDVPADARKHDRRQE
jgi:hypothetical protein